MAKYQKRPVVIDAVQWDGTKAGVDKIQAEFPELQTLLLTMKTGSVTEVWFWKIRVLGGGVAVEKDDFVLRGVSGEFYPCKPNIFARTYTAFYRGEPILNDKWEDR